MTMAKSAWTAVTAVLATLAVVLVMVFVPTNSAGAAGYTEWTNDGPVVTTHENVAPGTDTDTVRWLPVGEPTKHVTTEAVPESYTAWSDWAVVNATATAEQAAAIPAPTETEEWYAEGNEDAVSEVWANWSPDKQQGPFTGPPAYPTDPRGTWHVHNKIPGGHEGPDGVYQRDNPGNGNADWFYRQNAKAETYTIAKRTRTLIPAVAEVSHLDYKWQKQVRTVITDNPTTPTETPTTPVETPETPTETPEVPEETPVGNPNPNPTPTPENNPPKDTQVIECVDGVFVTTVNGEVISESGSCVERDENKTPVTFSETGL